MAFLKEYEKIKLIGKGSFATIWKVRHIKLDYIRAVKVSNEMVDGEDDPAYKSFEKECKVLLKIGNGSHPNIVHIYQPRLIENKAIVEMDCIDGETIDKYISRVKFVSIKEFYRFFEDIVGALAYCHHDIFRFLINPNVDNLVTDPNDGQKYIIDENKERELARKYGVTHNDIHSNNVMRRNYDGNFILLDFGLAIQDGKAVKSSSRRGGALEYMSPEKFDDSRSISTQSDVYSLGVLLYEVLAGRVPFVMNYELYSKNPTEASHQMMTAHKAAIPPSIEALRREAFEASNPGQTYIKDYPDWLEALIMRCLEKNPEDRYADAKELLEDFLKKIELADDSQLVFLKNENKQLESQVSFLTTDNTLLKNDNDTLKKRNELLSNRNDALTAENASFVNSNKELQQQNSQLASQNKTLTKELASKTTSDNEIQQLTSQNAELGKQKETLQKQVNELAAQSDTLKLQNQKLEATVKQANTQNTALQKENEKLASQNKTLTEEKAAQSTSEKELEQLAAQNAELGKQKETLQKQVNELAAQSDTLKLQNQKLEATVKQANTQNTALQKENEKLASQNKTLAEEKATQSTSEKELQEMASQNVALGKQNDALQKQVDSKTTECETLKSQNQQMETEADKIQKTLEKANSRIKELEKSGGKKGLGKWWIAAAVVFLLCAAGLGWWGLQKNSGLNDRNAQITQLEQNVITLQAQNDSLQIIIHDIMLHKGHSQTAKLTAKIKELESDVSRLKTDIANNEAKIKQLNTTISNNEATIKKKDKEIAELKKDLAKRPNTKVPADYEQIKSERDGLKKENEKLQLEIKKLNKNIEILKQTIKEKDRKIDSLILK